MNWLDGDKMIPVIKGIVKSAISQIPIIGNTALEILNEVESKQVNRKIQRLIEFYTNLANELERLKEKFNEECVKREDLLDIFEQTTHQVINERNEDKRRMFKNIFEHTITDIDFDFDDTEQFLRILHELSQFQLTILAVLYHPSGYNKQHGYIIPNPINNQYKSSWGQYSARDIFSRLFAKRKDEIQAALAFMYFNGLIEDKLMERTLQTNDNPIHILDNSLTPFGKRFVEYLIDSQD